MKLPHKVESLSELRLLAWDRIVECYISLDGGIAQSSKTIHYWPESQKPWDVFESTSESWEQYTDKHLGKYTNIPDAISKNALVIVDISQT